MAPIAPSSLVTDLVLNINLIFALTFLYDIIRTRLGKLPIKYYQLVLGLLFGIIAFVSMSFPVVLMPGLIFDFRTIIVLFSALFGGPISASVTVLIVCLYRIWMGGIGMIVGITVTLIAGLVGLGIREYQNKSTKPLTDLSIGHFLLIGIFLSTELLVILVILPIPFQEYVEMIQLLALPLFATYIIGSILVGFLIKFAETKTQNEERLAQLHREKLENEFQKKVEAEINQRQIHSSLGTLAGGIAHDFNNILAIILGNVLLIQDRNSLTSVKDKKYLNNAIMGCERAAELIHKIQRLSISPTDVVETIDLHELIQGIFDSTPQNSIEKKCDFEPRTFFVEGISSDVYQIFLNLTSNSISAIQERQTSAYKLESPWIRVVVASPDNERILIKFSDSGIGMTQEIAMKAFDPLFTTRRYDKGHGIGLAIVYNIVTRMKGRVYIDSTLGEGTTINIELPRAELKSSVEKTAEQPTTELHEEMGIKKGLIVDDNEDLRHITSIMLRRKGFVIEEAENGDEGWLLIQEKQYDFVLLDLIMPGTPGIEVLKNIKALNPEMKVIIITGYGEISSSDLEIADGVLIKPFNAEVLFSKLYSLFSSFPC